MTPWQFSRLVDAAVERRDSDHDRQAWFMWHQAALGGLKKLPPLKQFLSKYKKPVKGIDEGAIMARLKAYQEQRDSRR